MTYQYICEKCKKEVEIQKSIKDDIPSKIDCPDCGNICYRNWKTSIHIPDYMQAVNDINGDASSYSNFDNLKSRFKHASRPSGREKLYY